MRFAAKHVVTMVVSVCAAAVLAPISVGAATGTLVNITDPTTSSRSAKVSPANGLYVDTRPRVAPGQFNKNFGEITNTLPRVVVEVGYPFGIAVTELTMTVREGSSASTVGNDVQLISYVRTSGTQPCGGSGWVRTVLRTVTVPRNQTAQLLFSGPPLVLPRAASGQRVCLVAQQIKFVGGSITDIGVTGFTFE